MKTILQEIAEKAKKEGRLERAAIQAEIDNSTTSNDRRSFLKKAALGGIALGGLLHLSIEDTIAQTTQKVSRASSPSDLRITDLRVAEKGNTAYASRWLRIDTNQGIYGLGDMRDGGDQRLGLALKPKIVGLNPCNVEMIFKIINRFGGQGLLGTGVSAVEMACWDLCGKALGVPVWQLLGGRYRDKIRLYADTGGGSSPADQLERLRNRMEVQKYTWLKMDLGLTGVTDGLVNSKFWGLGQPRQPGSTPGAKPTPRVASVESYMSYSNTEAPFTALQLTDEALEAAAQRVEAVRNMTGMEIPLGADHFGYYDENQFIRLARRLDKYRLSFLEDCFPWFYTQRWKTLKESVETPVLTGETMYMLAGLEGKFKTLIDAQAVDIIHPDLVSAGGILETKKIGDYAEEAGIPMLMHHNSSPIAFMANVHCAAATENFLALEHHDADRVEWWSGLVKKTDGIPLITDGYGNVPLDAPGLGIELNEEYVKAEAMTRGKKYFEPTPEWDNDDIAPNRIWDKLWI